MIIEGKEYGTPVEGTHLLCHGNAPRRTPADRNKMAWYECECGERECRKFFCCRIADVKAGKQVSCGCVGRNQFTQYFEQRAANLSTAVKNEIFNLTHKAHRRRIRGTRRFGRWTERASHEDMARRFKLNKYIIDFVINARCRFIREVAKLGKYGWSVLSRTERAWFKYEEPTVRWRTWERESNSALVSAFEALPLIERLKKIAEHRIAIRKGEARSWVDIQALLLDPNTDIEIGPSGASIVMDRWLTK